jgi:tetraacyldisaccharide 4'-kinase
VDIVLLDALAPFGFGHLLPRGLLREPVEGLARAQIVALSRSDAIDARGRREIEGTVARHAPHAIWIEVVHRPSGLISGGATHDLAALSGQRVAAFCGIGNPAGFRHTLSACGLDVVSWLELPDHCAYGQPEMERITRWLETVDVEHVICTCKDLVKIPQEKIGGKKLWALNVEAEVVRGREELEEALEKIAARV